MLLGRSIPKVLIVVLDVDEPLGFQLISMILDLHLERPLQWPGNTIFRSQYSLILAYSNIGSTYFNIDGYDRAEEFMKASIEVGLKNYDEDNISVRDIEDLAYFIEQYKNNKNTDDE